LLFVVCVQPPMFRSKKKCLLPVFTPRIFEQEKNLRTHPPAREKNTRIRCGYLIVRYWIKIPTRGQSYRHYPSISITPSQPRVSSWVLVILLICDPWQSALTIIRITGKQGLPPKS
jgi:hypothetical protein